MISEHDALALPGSARASLASLSARHIRICVGCYGVWVDPFFWLSRPKPMRNLGSFFADAVYLLDLLRGELSEAGEDVHFGQFLVEYYVVD